MGLRGPLWLCTNGQKTAKILKMALPCWLHLSDPGDTQNLSNVSMDTMDTMKPTIPPTRPIRPFNFARRQSSQPLANDWSNSRSWLSTVSIRKDHGKSSWFCRGFRVRFFYERVRISERERERERERKRERERELRIEKPRISAPPIIYQKSF